MSRLWRRFLAWRGGGAGWFSTLAADCRYALRQMLHSPGFSAVAAVSLALGIAANTTVFSLVDAMWFRALPVRDPARVVRVAPLAADGRSSGVSWPEYDHLRRRATTLSALAAHYSTAPFQVRAGGESAEVQGAVVSANYFSLLGVKPVLGRFIRPEASRTRWSG
ncbi:MAG TPA: ABC transporter permease [Thermoanaerobaculia bacterium]|nr:ABC transporter permease [Thermoanaerobaculia bacterium]